MSIKFYTNPEYKALNPKWQRYDDFYEGDSEILKSYLRRYAIEDKNTEDGKKAWEQRLNRTFYTNFCEPILSIWISILFRKPGDYSAISEVITEDEQQDIDGEQTNLVSFIKEFTRQYLQFGRSFMFVDAPRGESVNRTTDQQLGLRPYGEIWKPLLVPDWEFASVQAHNRGSFKELHHQFIRIPPRSSLTDRPTQEIIRRVIKLDGTTYSTQLFRAEQKKNTDYNQLSEKVLFSIGLSEETTWEPIGAEVPYQDIKEIPIAWLNGRSWLNEIQPLCERYYNLDSNHDNIIYFQGYSRLAVSGPQTQTAVMSAAENTVMQFPEGTIITQITAEDPTASEKNLDRVENKIFKTGLNLLRQLAAGSNAVQDDDTQREEKDNIFALAEETITEVEEAANQFVRHWAAFKKKPDFEGEIVLNKQLGSEDYEKFITLYQALAQQRARYPETAKALDKRLVRYTDLSDEEQEKAKKEIDSAKAEESEEQQVEKRLKLIASGR